MQLLFKDWLKEDFHQGTTGTMGASLPIKEKKKRRVNLIPNPMWDIDRGQSYQSTKKDDGNG